jgi:hypothetical protein
MALLGLAGCQSTNSGTTSSSSSSPDGSTARISQEKSATAAVVAVDKGRRCVTLRSEDGRLFEVVCGAEVRNFDQITAGDTLRVGYRVAMTARRLVGAEATMPAAALIAGRAPVGQTPAAGVKIAASVRVKIQAIDASQDLVVFSMADGELIAHKISSDEGRTFVKSLKIGDIVQLDYAEALALGIEKVPGRG